MGSSREDLDEPGKGSYSVLCKRKGQGSAGLNDAWGKDHKNEGTLWLEITARRDKYSGNTSNKITELCILVG